MLDVYTFRSAIAFDRQLLLADAVDTFNWRYDLQFGVLCFGERFQWQAEVLGTESDESSTWLWAWANEASRIPMVQQGAALKLRTIGEERGIPELTEPLLPLKRASGHVFGSIAVGEGLGKAYYRAPYEGGAAFLLITDDKLQFQVDEPFLRVLSVFPQAIAGLELPDHREALRGYLLHYGFAALDEGGALLVREEEKEVLRAEFDEFGRLRELRGHVEQHNC